VTTGGHRDPQTAEDRRHLPVGHFDLVRDLPRDGCAVCRGASRSAWRYLDGLLWEGVTDPGIRTMTRASHGFCREHALMAISVASQQSGQLGMAILFEDLLRHLEEEATQPNDPGRGLRSRRNARSPDRLSPHAVCHACVSARATERNYLCVLARTATSSEVADLAAEHAPCLCLPHLRRGLSLDDLDEEDRRRLIAIYVMGSERLRTELAEFIRKRDYRFASEPVSEAEATAWYRAVRAIVGLPAPRSSDR
jgi:Family of unknown function (DUF6062)